MKKILLLFLVIIGFYSCNSTKEPMATSADELALKEQDTVRIANEEADYEIIIIEPGFNFWLQSVAKPEGYYTQSFLEGRNALFVAEWNRRVINPSSFDPNLYQMQIDYLPNIDYGYEVNYKLYYYFIYFQRTYKQKLAGFIPRI